MTTAQARTRGEIVSQHFGIEGPTLHMKPALVALGDELGGVESAEQANRSLHHAPSMVSPSRAWFKFHLITILALCAGCAHPPASSPHQEPSQEIQRVVLGAAVPGGALFCVEHLYLSWPTDEPFIRRESGLTCQWTVAEIRNWLASHKAADE